MHKMHIARVALSATITIFLLFIACTKESGEVKGQLTNEKLFALSSDTTGFTYYKNNPSILGAGGNSPHGYMRVRFNSVAWNALDTVTRKLEPGNTFPDSSLIVKEVFTSLTGSVRQLAVMMKLNRNWEWAEYSPQGAVDYSVYKRGGICTSCHSESGNRDYVRLFELH